MDKTLKVAILVGPDTGNEYEAIRQTLEYFGAQVMVFFIGRPKDFTDCLQGASRYQGFDHYLLSFHGEDGAFCMPKLASDVYLPDEPKTNLNATDINTLCQLNAALILCTGCTLGSKDMAKSFLDNGVHHYIGTPEYIEGNAMLLFIHRFYYEILSSNISLEEAAKISSNTDSETKLVRFY